MKKLILLTVLAASVFVGGTVSTANAQWRGGYYGGRGWNGGYYRGGGYYGGYRSYRPYYGYGRGYYGYPAYNGYSYGYRYPGIGVYTPGFSVGVGGYYW